MPFALIRTALSGDRFFSYVQTGKVIRKSGKMGTLSTIVVSELGTESQLPSGFELWNGGVTYTEDLDEAAELVIAGES